MDEREFVRRFLDDKKYRIEICRNIPDEVLEAYNEQGEGGEQGSDQNLGAIFGGMLAPAAAAMGFSFDDAAIVNEVNSQLGSKGDFAKMRFVVSFAKSCKKAGKGQK